MASYEKPRGDEDETTLEFGQDMMSSLLSQPNQENLGVQQPLVLAASWRIKS